MTTTTASPPDDAQIVERDQLLVRRALTGDDAACEELVARLLPVVRARARRACARDRRGMIPGNADDLMQETWLRLVSNSGQRLKAWDPERGLSLERYVGMVAQTEIEHVRVRACAKKRGGHLRPVGAEVLESMTAPVPSPEERLLAYDLSARLGAHLENELPTRGRLVFRHAFTDGRSPAEVAQLMGVKIQVVYNWQHKIRALARAFLGR